MSNTKITIAIVPTPAAQDASEKVLRRISRITRIPQEEVRQIIYEGRTIKLVTRQHPRIPELIAFIRSLGFSVSLGPSSAEQPKSSAPEKRTGVRTGKRSGSSKHVTEWKVGDVIENLYDVRDIKYGGMGAVYVVNHLRWNTMIAVKSLFFHLRENEEDRALFVKEAETWIDIGFHPNIAACYYVRNIAGSPRIFIEYADGGSLTEWIEGRGGIEWGELLDLMVQVTDGLAHAHAKGLVHRDVKPANCMLTREGVLKVTDFGLTKRPSKEKAGDLTPISTFTDTIIQHHSSVTAAGMGTPAYMAPEMWKMGADVGPQADVYEFGVMFFEICCGRKPFVARKGDKPNKLALAHLKQQPPRPSLIRKDIPASVEEIILNCMEKDPAKRYPSMRELRKDLAAAYENVSRTPYTREPPDEVKLLSDALNNRAVSLMDLNWADEARSVLAKALESDPHHPEAVYNVGVLEWLRTGELDREVVVRLEEVVKTPEYVGRGGHLLGRCLLTLGDAEGAVKAAELSLAAEDATEGRLKHYAIALVGAGRHQDAVTHLETYLEQFPQDDEAAGWLIGALMHSGLHEEGLARLKALPAGSQISGLGLEGIASSFVFANLSESLVLKGHNGWITAAIPFPTSGKFVSGGRDRTIRIWDAATGEEIKSISVLGDAPVSLWIAPDEQMVAMAGPKAGAPVNLLDLESGRVVGSLSADGNITAAGFSPDGSHILTVEEKGAARLWDTAQFRGVSTIKIPAHTAAAAVFDSESQPEIFIAGVDRRIKRVCSADATTLGFEKAHEDQVISLSVAPDGTRLVTGGKDKRAVLWDARSGQVLAQFQAHRGPVSVVAINPNGQLAATYDTTSGIKLWDSQTGRVLRTFDTMEGQINCLAFTLDGERLLAGGRDMAVRIWQVGSRPVIPHLTLAKIQPVQKQIRSGQQFEHMIETAKKAVRKRAFATAYSLIRKAQTLPGYERSDVALETISRMSKYGVRVGLRGGWNVGTLSFSSNGREAVSGGDDRSVRLWDLNTGKNILALSGHTDTISSVALSRDGKQILSSSWDGSIKLWNRLDGTLLKTFKGHDGEVAAAAFVDDSRLILSAGFDGVVKMWDADSGRLLRDLRGHTDRITSLAVSVSAERFITGAMDGTARVWDVKRGTTIRTLEAGESGVRVVAFPSDDNFALTGENDGICRIWNLETGECLREFKGHAREITGGEFSSNGRFVITSSGDGAVMIWELDWKWRFPGQKEATTGEPVRI
ncbi:MAG: protein kinase [Deltaproteobacteria bacterium]